MILERKAIRMKALNQMTCEWPHCGKEGGAPQMKQWHFDNCKRKAF